MNIFGRANRDRTRAKTGFTIVEVLIVLAVAGTIMTVILLVVPTIQRTARDNNRRVLATKVQTELDNYNNDNQGSLPFGGTFGDDVATTYNVCRDVTGSGSCNDWQNTYITGKVDLSDPSTGNPTSIKIAYDVNSTTLPDPAGNPPTQKYPGFPDVGYLYIVVGAACANTGQLKAVSKGSATTRQYAVAINLDKAGTYYCIDNSH